MARRRGLQPEDADLWHRVAQTITPLHPVRARPVAIPETVALKPVKSTKRTAIPVPFRIGEKASNARDHVLIPTLSDHLAKAAVQMDHKAFARMSHGKLAPEARIDLHGMTLAEAHPALNQFILSTHAHGLRLVLVITGKGKRGDDHGPIPQRPGVLKHQVPQWLAMHPLGSMVLQIAEAHLKHGGTGAYYVYLRRTR